MAPFSIVLSGRRYSDTEIDMDELHDALENKDNLPTTSMPSVGEFLQLFTNLSQQADAILHISITSVFSAAYQNALQARKRASRKLSGTRIEIIDSRTTGMGVCLLAREVLRFAASDKNLCSMSISSHRR